MDAPADLAPIRLQTLLRGRRYGRSMRVLSETASTNDDARTDALAGAPDGHVVVADFQRAGRGSHGRVWTSPAGGDLYLSIVARPAMPLAELPPLTLAVGLGVADAVLRTFDVDEGLVPEVKWPNDVWLRGRKCAGILIEASSTGEIAGPVVIGIGLNVNRLEWPDELRSTATSLRAERAAGTPLDRGRVLALLLDEVERWVDVFSLRGGAAIASALDSRLALRGQRVRCGTVVGTLAGIAPSGAVRIATDDAMRELVAGRLELVE
jgi:BirA family biotin operon repressor/biotin-[acetyl-CoA-carboxylase] ligase